MGQYRNNKKHSPFWECRTKYTVTETESQRRLEQSFIGRVHIITTIVCVYVVLVVVWHRNVRGLGFFCFGEDKDGMFWLRWICKGELWILSYDKWMDELGQDILKRTERKGDVFFVVANVNAICFFFINWNQNTKTNITVCILLVFFRLAAEETRIRFK